MRILYLSTLASKSVNEQIFEKYGQITSHASQKFNKMIIDALNSLNVQTDMLSSTEIYRYMDQNRLYHKGYKEVQSGANYEYMTRINIPIIGQLQMIFSTWIRIINMSKTNQYDALICDPIVGEFSIASWLAKPFSKQLKRIAILTDVPRYRAGQKKARPIRAADMIKFDSLRHYDGYIFLTQAMNEIVNRRGKPYVIIEGMVRQDQNRIEITLADKKQPPVVMMAGLLDSVFGVESLVEAFLKADTKNAELHLYGTGDYIAKIMQISSEHQQIKYMGQLQNSEIIKWEAAATLLVNPRTSEGEYTKYSFPSKNMEYIASGTPMIGYALPGMPKEYNDHFIIVEEDGIDGLFKVIEYALSLPPETLIEMGRKNKEWILHHKNSKVQVQKMIQLIERVMNTQ